MQPQKWQNDLNSFPRQATIQHHSNPSLCPDHWCQRSQSWLVLWRPTRPARTNTKKDVLFIIGDWNAEVGSQVTPGDKRQVWPWSTKWSRAKANQVVSRENAGHIKHPFLTTQAWISPDDQYQNQIDNILCRQRWRSSFQSAKTRPRADCGSYHKLVIAKFKFKLKKVGKTTRLFRYDLNQILYDYTVEVINRFKGLDQIECLKIYGWGFVTLYRRQWAKPSQRKRNAKRQSDCLRRLYK